MPESGVRAWADGHNEIAGCSRADILDSMLIVRMDKADSARTETVTGSVHRELDRAFTDEPHLGVQVMMRSVRRAARRQGTLVHLQRLAGGQLALEDAAHFSMI